MANGYKDSLLLHWQISTSGVALAARTFSARATYTDLINRIALNTMNLFRYLVLNPLYTRYGFRSLSSLTILVLPSATQPSAAQIPIDEYVVA